MSVIFSGEVADRLPELINPDVQQIAVDDPRYLEHLEHVSENNERLQIFGKEVLDRLGPNSIAPGWVKAEFSAMRDKHPQIIDPIIAEFGGLGDMAPWNTPDLRFNRWLRQYVDHYEAEAEALDERIDQVVEEFGNRLVDKYSFVSADVVEERLKRTSVGYYDFINGLLMSAPMNGESPRSYVQGRYCPSASHMSIGLDKRGFTLQDRIISHEAIHATSGRSIQLIDKASSGKIVRKFQEKRLGLEYYDERGIPINRAINEAVTEYINLALYEYDAFRAVYPEERRVFREFLVSGFKEIDPEVVIRAYFENEDPSLGSPAMKELEAEATKAYGQNVFAVIEGTIKNADGYDQGLRKAGKYLTSFKSRNIMSLAEAMSELQGIAEGQPT